MHGRGVPLMDHGETSDYLQAPADSEREFSCRREVVGTTNLRLKEARAR